MPRISGWAKTVLALALLATRAAAHEFWIEPRDYTVDVGEVIEADLRNGMMFKGPTYPYLTSFFTDFVVIDSAGARKVEGRLGDSPAVQVKALRGGLHVFAYASTVNVVNYREFSKFEGFVRSKGLERILEEHQAKGYPTDRVKETYYRYAKSLVKVGSGAGRDRRVGFPIELVAEINPYSAAAAEGVRFRLYWKDAPLAHWDVQAFHYPPGAKEAVKTHLETDATGRVFVPADGGGEFLVNAVQITPPRAEDADKNAQWESVWASVTYELPPAR